MKRRDFLSILAQISVALGTGTFGCDNTKKPHILLRSSWQTINIGDIAHTPGILHLLEQHLPNVNVTLWPSDLGRGAEEMLRKRFPLLNIVLTAEDEQNAIEQCDFMLHGSGPFIVGRREIRRWRQETDKPYGIYGVTFTGKRPEHIELINDAKFTYFRDSVSLQLAKEMGAKCPVMEFTPDAAFATDVRNDQAAENFLKQNNLEPGEFLCCIPRYRYTQNWLIPDKNRALNHEKHARNEEMKDHDHMPLREAIIQIVRNTDKKILLCPEDVTQMQVGKDMIYDRLPADVKQKVFWRRSFWLTDEALSTYLRSAGLFGNEMHSPIMCIGNGIPAIVCRFDEQTSKGIMWRDIGLDDWLFDLDNPDDYNKVVPAVLHMAMNPEAANAKARQAQDRVRRLHTKSMYVINDIIANG